MGFIAKNANFITRSPGVLQIKEDRNGWVLAVQIL
jgi:hypothetical protein